MVLLGDFNNEVELGFLDLLLDYLRLDFYLFFFLGFFSCLLSINENFLSEDLLVLVNLIRVPPLPLVPLERLDRKPYSSLKCTEVYRFGLGSEKAINYVNTFLN